MGENKRIFLTGALIAGLLLLTPFYLQMIGVQPDVESVQQSPESFDNTNASGFDITNSSSEDEDDALSYFAKLAE